MIITKIDATNPFKALFKASSILLMIGGVSAGFSPFSLMLIVI